jgi:hypothetical protein
VRTLAKPYGIALLGIAILGCAVFWRSKGGGFPARPAAGQPRPPESAPLVSAPSRSAAAAEPGTRTAWREGYRAAFPEGGARRLSGWVTEGGVPQPFRDVFVEWVISFEGPVAPATSAEVRLDPEGTRWIRKTLQTNREGYFSVDGLPDVQLRVQVGPRVFPMKAAADVRIACD